MNSLNHPQRNNEETGWLHTWQNRLNCSMTLNETLFNSLLHMNIMYWQHWCLWQVQPDSFQPKLDSASCSFSLFVVLAHFSGSSAVMLRVYILIRPHVLSCPNHLTTVFWLFLAPVSAFYSTTKAIIIAVILTTWKNMTIWSIHMIFQHNKLFFLYCETKKLYS